MVTLNKILQKELVDRDLRFTKSLTKTIWQKLVYQRDRVGRLGSHWIWVCDVHEDRVVVFVDEHYPDYETKTFRAADPDFVEKVFQAIDIAIARKR